MGRNVVLRILFVALLAMFAAALPAGPLVLEAPARGLRATFDGEGMSLAPASRAWTFHTGAARLGRNAAASFAPKTAPRREGDRVVYDRPWGDEWYAAAPGGIEQGCTLRVRPAGDGPLRLTLDCSGLDQVCRLDDKIAFRRGDVRVLEFGKILVQDAVGRPLPARFCGPDPGVAIEIDDRGARYPLLVDPVFSPPPDAPVFGTIGVNGVVTTLLPGPGRLMYVGGGFTALGVSAGGGASLSAASGAPDAPTPAIVGTVSAAVSDGAGGWFAGGTFNTVQGLTRHNLVHLLADGSVDPFWDPGPDGTVKCLLLSGGVLYAGGPFSSAGGASRTGLVALDPATGQATAWDAASDSEVDGIRVSGGTLYVCGGFTTIGGQARLYLAGLSPATALATAFDPQPDSNVQGISLSGGTVYAFGIFTTIGGQPRAGLAALDGASGTAQSWAPAAVDGTLAMEATPTAIYLGGLFTAAGGQPRSSLAALDPGTGLATSWNPNASGEVDSLAVSGSTVYAGGTFGKVGGLARLGVAAIDTGTGLPTAWAPSSTVFYQVFALAPAGASVFVGGAYSVSSPVPRNSLAAIDLDSGQPTSWNPDVSISVNSLALFGTTLYVGGGLQSVGALPRDHLAAIDTATGTATAWNPGASGIVRAIGIGISQIFIGGEFTTAGGASRNHLAGINPATGAATAWDPNADDTVSTLVVAEPLVYVGGAFLNAGGTARSRIAALQVSDGTATAFDPNANSNVRFLALSGTTLYAGGSFTNVGTFSRSHLAALDTLSAGVATAWDPSPSGNVRGIATSGGDITVVGDFQLIGGGTHPTAAMVDPTTGVASSWTPSPNASVIAVAQSGREVVLGGVFNVVNGTMRNSLAHFNDNSVVQVTSTTADGTYGIGATLTIQVNFLKAVTVTGSPRIILETGATDRAAPYLGGSGTSTLHFRYIVQAGDVSARLDCTPGGFDLNGGAVMTNVNPTPVSLPTGAAAGSLATQKNLIIDSQAPAPPVITSPADGSDTGPFVAALLAGTSEPSAQVAVTVDTVLVGTATATPGGTWAFTTPALAAGTHTILATATDLAGNPSGPSTPITVTVPGGGGVTNNYTTKKRCGLTGLEAAGLVAFFALLRRRRRSRAFQER